MQFDPPLISATLLKRYKRFLADVRFADGRETTVHCANPGSMLGLAAPGNPVWVSDSRNPKRKLPLSLEMIEVEGALVGINTHLANKLVEEAILGGQIAALRGYGSLRREVKYGQNSRIDFLLEDPARRPCYVEVKSVTLSRTKRLAEFPDSITARGTRHLGELEAQIAQGARAVQLFVVQREDCDLFRPASDIDPAYAKALAHAASAGVEIFTVKCEISPQGIRIDDPIAMEIT
jgi:sugar fermentation stimulation protein A